MTDANVALGRLDGENFSGRRDAARRRRRRARLIDARWRTPLSLATEAAAEGLLAVVNANLGAAIRLSLFEKGVDPARLRHDRLRRRRRPARLDVADETGIRRVVFPESASTLSAYGILHSDLTHDLVRSRVLDATPEKLGAIAPLLESLVADARTRLDADAIPQDDRQIELAADMHYKGQAFELTVPLRSARARRGGATALLADFHDHPPPVFLLFESGLARRDRVAARPRRSAACRSLSRKAAEARDSGKPVGNRRIWLSGGWRDVAVWNRADVFLGATIEGPAVIEEAYTSVLLMEGWSCRRDKSGHLVAEEAGP